MERFKYHKKSAGSSREESCVNNSRSDKQLRSNSLSSVGDKDAESGVRSSGRTSKSLSTLATRMPEDKNYDSDNVINTSSWGSGSSSVKQMVNALETRFDPTLSLNKLNINPSSHRDLSARQGQHNSYNGTVSAFEARDATQQQLRALLIKQLNQKRRHSPKVPENSTIDRDSFVDTVEFVDNVDNEDNVDNLDNVHTIDSVKNIDNVINVDNINSVENRLAKISSRSSERRIIAESSERVVNGQNSNRLTFGRQLGKEDHKTFENDSRTFRILSSASNKLDNWKRFNYNMSPRMESRKRDETWRSWNNGTSGRTIGRKLDYETEIEYPVSYSEENKRFPSYVSREESHQYLNRTESTPYFTQLFNRLHRVGRYNYENETTNRANKTHETEVTKRAIKAHDNAPDRTPIKTPDKPPAKTPASSIDWGRKSLYGNLSESDTDEKNNDQDISRGNPDQPGARNPTKSNNDRVNKGDRGRGSVYDTIYDPDDPDDPDDPALSRRGSDRGSMDRRGSSACTECNTVFQWEGEEFVPVQDKLDALLEEQSRAHETSCPCFTGNDRVMTIPEIMESMKPRAPSICQGGLPKLLGDLLWDQALGPDDETRRDSRRGSQQSQDTRRGSQSRDSRRGSRPGQDTKRGSQRSQYSDRGSQRSQLSDRGSQRSQQSDRGSQRSQYNDRGSQQGQDDIQSSQQNYSRRGSQQDQASRRSSKQSQLSSPALSKVNSQLSGKPDGSRVTTPKSEATDDSDSPLVEISF